MLKYFIYFKYLFKHKYYTCKACWKKGLYWQGIVHDLSKLLPDELIPYVNFFEHPPKRKETGYCKPTDTGDKAFDMAWLYHQKRNRHHWQYWCCPKNEGGLEILPMPHKYRLEMLADWWSASMAQGYGGKSKDWYEENKSKIQLHPETKKWVEKNISNNFIK